MELAGCKAVSVSRARMHFEQFAVLTTVRNGRMEKKKSRLPPNVCSMSFCQRATFKLIGIFGQNSGALLGQAYSEQCCE